MNIENHYYRIKNGSTSVFSFSFTAISDELLRQYGLFTVRNHPFDDITAEDVENDTERPLGIALPVAYHLSKLKSIELSTNKILEILNTL